MRSISQPMYNSLLMQVKRDELQYDKDVKSGKIDVNEQTYEKGYIDGMNRVLNETRPHDRYTAILVNAGNDVNGNSCKAYIIIDTVYSMIVNVINVGYRGNYVLREEKIRLNEKYNKQFILDTATYEDIAEIWKSIHISKREYTDLLKFGEDVRKELI